MQRYEKFIVFLTFRSRFNLKVEGFLGNHMFQAQG